MKLVVQKSPDLTASSSEPRFRLVREKKKPEKGMGSRKPPSSSKYHDSPKSSIKKVVKISSTQVIGSSTARRTTPSVIGDKKPFMGRSSYSPKNTPKKFDKKGKQHPPKTVTKVISTTLKKDNKSQSRPRPKPGKGVVVVSQSK
ncbi:hypothetical protein ADUPG1_000592 [Aduncisulcus paluster]|uniref:Uncharacterized protein n=1 Tax=Aduncisulcus paluster TaxID=2918883 RepID=A0ABQ5KAX3_9EUKA|nr:hypothetical protein ADUPG1_000592 [Aduncisulcus paluster]